MVFVVVVVVMVVAVVVEAVGAARYSLISYQDKECIAQRKDVWNENL